jgi:hypothetical protein
MSASKHTFTSLIVNKIIGRITILSRNTNKKVIASWTGNKSVFISKEIN